MTGSDEPDTPARNPETMNGPSTLRRLARTVYPTLRDAVILVMTVAVGSTVLWIAGGPSSTEGPGDSMLFADGTIIAPTVRRQADGFSERIGRGFDAVVDPMIPAHDVAELGDQPEVRASSLLAAQRLVDTPLAAPEAVSKAGRVYGGSSGLAWALAALGQLQPGLTAGRVVAASATLTPHGSTGSVDGLFHKINNEAMVDAEVLFVHAGQATDVRSMLRDTENAPVVVGVANLEQAAAVLCALTVDGKVCRQFRSAAGTVTVRLPADPGLCRSFATLSSAVLCTTDLRTTTIRTAIRPG